MPRLIIQIGGARTLSRQLAPDPLPGLVDEATFLLTAPWPLEAAICTTAAETFVLRRIEEAFRTSGESALRTNPGFHRFAIFDRSLFTLFTELASAGDPCALLFEVQHVVRSFRFDLAPYTDLRNSTRIVIARASQYFGTIYRTAVFGDVLLPVSNSQCRYLMRVLRSSLQT